MPSNSFPASEVPLVRSKLLPPPMPSLPGITSVHAQILKDRYRFLSTCAQTYMWTGQCRGTRPCMCFPLFPGKEVEVERRHLLCIYRELSVAVYLSTSPSFVRARGVSIAKISLSVELKNLRPLHFLSLDLAVLWGLRGRNLVVLPTSSPAFLSSALCVKDERKSSQRTDNARPVFFP